MTESVLFTWSGGKDSAMALYELQMQGACDVAALLTTVTRDYGRVSMHGVREELLDRQAEPLRLPLDKVYIGAGASNEDYEAAMRDALYRYRERGVQRVVFGDIFLEDLRKYREDNLARVGMQAMFPLWKRDTAELARMFVDVGLETTVTCVDSEYLDGNFAGRDYDEQFLADLPPTVDPCGENGEFHSFVYDGPIFREGVRFEKGEVVLRDNRYYFCDLVPV
jgi:uncharacterized protein (TIGR00290 family)